MDDMYDYLLYTQFRYKSNLMNHCTILTVTIILLLSSQAFARTIQVPHVNSDQTLLMRVGELYQADRVFNIFGGLEKIYKKEVLEIVDGKETPFSECYENPPEASFKIRGEHLIGGKRSHRKTIVYDFQEIKYPKNLIDVETYSNYVYYVREDGAIKIAKIDDSQITDIRKIKTSQTDVNYGNFVILPNATEGGTKGFGVFLTQNQATIFDLEGGQKYSTFNISNQLTGFESAIRLEDNYLAVALGTQGGKIFAVDFDTQKLTVEVQLDKKFLNLENIDIQDVAYDPIRKILFVLDRHIGVIPLQLNITSKTITARLTSSTIKNSQCNVIYYDQQVDQLYINCRQLHKYRISKWPVFDEVILPRQEISVRDIVSSGNTVALVGRNIFEVINLERKVAVYEDKLLDKLILKEKTFISGNQNYIITGDYEIFPPSLACQASEQQSVGKHKILFKVTAECNSQYFDRVGFHPGSFEKEDRCVYTVYHHVKIWKAAAINVKAFGIIGVIILLLGLGIIIWWLCSFINLRKLRAHLLHYQSVGSGQDNQGSSVSDHKQPEEVIEMKQVEGPKVDAEGRAVLNEEVDVPHQLHDIE